MLPTRFEVTATCSVSRLVPPMQRTDLPIKCRRAPFWATENTTAWSGTVMAIHAKRPLRVTVVPQSAVDSSAFWSGGKRMQQDPSPLRAGVLSLIKPEWLFVALGSVFGLLFLILTPPFQIPDEPAHFLRAYQVAFGEVVPVAEKGVIGGQLPVALERAVDPFRALPFSPTTKTSIGTIVTANVPIDRGMQVFLPTATYPPMSYAPQVLGIWLAALLDLGAIATLYVARLFGLVFWLVSVGFAVRVMPVGKPALIAVSLLPITVFMAGGVSTDSFTYSIVALATAYALKCATAEDSLTTRQVLNVVVLSLLVSLLKTPYSMLFLVFLAVPASKFSRTKKHVLAIVATAAACAVLAASWTLLVRVQPVPFSAEAVVSPAMQARSISQDPTNLLFALGRTYGASNLLAIAQMIGHLGWTDTTIRLRWILIAMAAVFWSFLTVENVLSSSEHVRIRKGAMLGLIVLIVLAISLVLYLSGNEVGSRARIIGLQARYYTPLLVFGIPLAAMRRHFVRESEYQLLWLAAAEMAVLSAAAGTLLGRYFGI